MFNFENVELHINVHQLANPMFFLSMVPSFQERISNFLLFRNILISFSYDLASIPETIYCTPTNHSFLIKSNANEK